jgi:threonylcarbamoyladenosine tRNA methylthiotransferase MtaB
VKFSIVTFGCRVNQADSLHLEEEFRRSGGEPGTPDAADVVVVNTCSVTANADQGARQTIRRIARTNPAARIVATGCYATRCSSEVEALAESVTVIRNDDKRRLLDASGLTTDVRFGDGDGPCGAAIEPGVAGRTAFTLRVQTGCDQVCSYCIIPTTRGAGRSVPVFDVLADVRRVAGAGFREIALTGVHLGSYGRDLSDGSSLLTLLRRLADLDADVTFRISSLEPMDCSDDIIDLVADSDGRFAPHFHLPLQHASDRMLAAMCRPYTRGYYDRLVKRIVERLPHASIGTDMIVGFPGERDEDFAENLDYLAGAPFSHVHVFPYSDRPGTPASAMDGKVAGSTIRARSTALRQVGRELSRRFRAAQVGSIRDALTLDDGSVAVTDNYLKVGIGEGRVRNLRVKVRIDAVDADRVVGTVC